MNSADVGAFAGDFWEARYNGDDVRAYKRYLKIVNLSKQGHTAASIERILRTNNVGKYLKGQKKSFLVNLEEWRERLGPPPKGFQWMPIRLKPRGTPGEEWISIPRTINSFEDILSVLKQRTPTASAFRAKGEFGYKSRKELVGERGDMLGFTLGAFIGDAGKNRKGESRFPSMALSLVLSKNKPNSFRFGEFTSLCVRATLGIEMHRIADRSPSRTTYTDAECFQWITPASPLVSWLFHVCLGLKTGELTTYDSLKMDWLLNTSTSFKVHLLQGIAESDGWVDAANDQVSLVSSPNSRLFAALFKSIGVETRIDRRPPVEILQISTNDAARLPLFNPRIRSAYHEEMVVMSGATGLPPRKRIPHTLAERILELANEDRTYTQICHELARTSGFKVSGATVKKYVMQQGRA